jgi:proline iminopeptidase
MPFLEVSDGHRLYYEIHGAPEGKPAVVLHGGPGGGLQRSVLKTFDLHRWRVVLFDQRGCGRSQPGGVAGLRANTTRHLMRDIEALRHVTLGDRIRPWTVFGGSWGSTLALAYYAAFPHAVAALVLRGICLMSREEQRWLYESGGASQVFPEEWRRFTAGTTGGSDQRNYRRLTRTFHRRLRSRDRATRRRAARQWWGWESALSFLRPRPDDTPAAKAEDLARLETHYFAHDAWLRPGALLAAARRIPASVPIRIVQGRYDMVCPVASAVALHRAIPHSLLTIVPDAGHAASEPGIAAALKAAVREIE